MQELLEEIRHLRPDRKALRSFGLTVGAVFLAIAAFVFWRTGWSLTPAVRWVGAIGVALAALGLVVPMGLAYPYRIWMGLALVLGFLMSHVVLGIVYFLLVTPIGFVFRLRGKDLMDRRMQPGASTYWRPKVYLNTSRERLEKYY